MSQATTPLGGFEALVAAATAAKQVGGNDKRRGGKRGAGSNGVDNSLIDPTLTGGNGNDTAQALASLFTNPIFVQALAATTQSALPAQPLAPNSLGALSHPQQQIGQVHADSSTPFQQTRSGRISRPPVHPPQYNLLQALAAEADTPNFEGMLKTVAQNPNTSTQLGSGQVWAPNNDGGQWGGQTLADITAGGSGGMKDGLSPDDFLDGAEGDLPAWPLPPSGPGGRKTMPRDEMLARRRARNRVAAVESRKKRREHISEVESRLQQREMAYRTLQLHCQSLEQQVERLQQVITSAGLTLPSALPTPNATLSAPTAPFSVPTIPNIPSILSLPNIANDTPASYTSFDDPFPPFDAFFNIDMDGEDDGEFLPPTSPINESDAETPAGRSSRKKGKKRARTEMEDDDEEFEDDDVEDEDLFLPIEDVPVPPAAQMDSAMRSLGVDNQEQLASLINKMVTAGKEGMTSEMVDKLKVLLALVGPNGTWAEKPSGE